jgi:hypothetical protein
MRQAAEIKRIGLRPDTGKDSVSARAAGKREGRPLRKSAPQFGSGADDRLLAPAIEKPEMIVRGPASAGAKIRSAC